MSADSHLGVRGRATGAPLDDAMVGRSTLRLGVILDEGRTPAWVAWILHEARSHPSLTLAVIVRCRLREESKRMLFSLYERADRRLFRLRPDALARVEALPQLAGVQRLDAADVAGIRAQNLDVLLWLGGTRPEGSLTSAARFGVWAFRHGSDGPPLFDELARGDRTAQVQLEVLGSSGGRVIWRSALPTDMISLHRARNPAYWMSARFAMRRLEDLACGRWQPSAEPTEPVAGEAASPSAAETVQHVARIAARAVGRKLRLATFQHQWYLGVRPRSGDRLPGEDPAPWHVVLPPRDCSYTDPFVVGHDGETLVFFEVLPHCRAARGRLAVGRLEADGRLTDVEPILPAAHHVSYPYVFEAAGQRFLIPEMGAVERVQLFAATDFPVAWEPVATLLEGVNAVDASVMWHGGRYWMWVNMSCPGGRLSVETFLYFSDRLDGNWTPHPHNPVVSDVRCARPAGRPFLLDDRVIRPSQDCSSRYGASVVFNEVDCLSAECYREHPVGSLAPRWAGRPNLAAHTYTFGGRWEATDGLHAFPRTRMRVGPPDRHGRSLTSGASHSSLFSR